MNDYVLARGCFVFCVVSFMLCMVRSYDDRATTWFAAAVVILALGPRRKW